MKSGAEIERHIRQTLSHISRRPLMYGQTAEGVDLLYAHYYSLLAMLHDRDEAYTSICDEVHAEAGCDAAGFPFRYRRDRPDATEREVADYVVEQWRKIGQRLGFPIAPTDY